MDGMTLINMPTCAIMGKVVFDCLRDYEKQKKDEKDPVFKASEIGLGKEKFPLWK